MPRPRQRPSERRARDDGYGEAILETAERLFADKGYAETRMQEVAEGARTSLRTVYRLFPSKRDLYGAINARRGAEIVDATIAAMPDFRASPPANTVALILRGMSVYIGFFARHTAYLKMSLRDGYVWYHGSATPNAEQHRAWERGSALIEAAMRWGIEAGVFVGEDPPGMARTLTALHQTRLANWLIAGATLPADELIAGAQAEFLRTFCRPDYAQTLLSRDGKRPAPCALDPALPLPALREEPS